ADWAIVGEQFTYLRLDVVFDVAREVLLFLDEIPVIAVAVRMVPVLGLRIIEAELYALTPALRRQFLQRIAAERRCVDDVVVGKRAVEHTKAVMMLRGDHQVAHPRFSSQRHPGCGVKLYWIEAA